MSRRMRSTASLRAPLPALATSEMVSVVENGVSGFLTTEPARLPYLMRTLLQEPALARELGERARQTALERFSIGRFKKEWDRAFALVGGKRLATRKSVGERAG